MAKTLTPANGSMPSPFDKRNRKVARDAGGKTNIELAHARIFDPETRFWWDELSLLWIPNGILLFRPWNKKPAPAPIDIEPVGDPYKRDTMQLED